MQRIDSVPAPLRDKGTLKSAIVRPQMHAHYEGADLLTQAVTLILAISQAQAFVDGNKRTAMYVGLVFLDLNGWHFQGDDELLAVLIEEAATQPAEVATQALADWLRPSRQREMPSVPDK